MLLIADGIAIVGSGMIVGRAVELFVSERLYPDSITVFMALGFFIIAEKSRLYHGGFFSPGMPLSPQEEMRRVFYIIIGLLTIRLFYFPEFPNFVPLAERYQVPELCLKMLLVYLPLPFMFFAVTITRWLARTMMLHCRIGIVPVAIWGAGNSGGLLIEILNKSRYHGLKPLLIIDDDPAKTGSKIGGVPVVGNLEDNRELVTRLNINHVIICQPLSCVINNIERANSCFKHISFVGAIYDFPGSVSYLHDIFGITLVESKSGLKIKTNIMLRGILNVALSLVAMLLLAFPMALIALLVKLNSKGPVFYVARRLGKRGQEISILKFRTMFYNADERLEDLLENSPEMKNEWSTNFKLKNDPRVTRLGKFLRRTSLDELPQLFSVLKGELNLVGPRPIVEDEIRYFGETYDLISSVNPGITGMWQVSGRNNTSYAERVLLERYYVMNWSPWLDIYILIKTVLEVALCRGAY